MGEFPVKDEALRDSLDSMIREVYHNLSRAALIINDKYKRGDISLPHYCDALEALFKCLKEVFDINIISTTKWNKTKIKVIEPHVRVNYKGQLIGSLVIMHTIEDLDGESVFIKESTYKRIHNVKFGGHLKGTKLFGFKNLLFHACEATPQQKYKIEKLIFDMV